MKSHWLDDPANVRRLWRAFLGGLALLVSAEIVIDLHPRFAFERLFAFHAWFGFLACAAMIALAKLLGVVLKRPESYYDES